MFDQPGGCPASCNGNDDLCVFDRDGTKMYQTNIATGVSPVLGKPLGSVFQIDVQQGDVLTFDRDPADPYWNIGLEIWDGRCEYDQEFNSGDLCLDTGFLRTCEDPTKPYCSDYVKDYEFETVHLVHGGENSCGYPGSYYVGYFARKLFVQTPYIPIAGEYIIDFEYGIGSPGQGNENFKIVCGADEYQFNDIPGDTPRFEGDQVTCDFEKGVNMFSFEGDEDSVHFDYFRIFSA